MIQTLALLLDAYRELNAKKMFWITMGLSGLVVAIFGCIGINDQGLKVLVWQMDMPMLSTEVMPAATFYKMMFVRFGISFWLAWVATILALISTGTIFPDMMTTGSIDTLLSKPISRLRLFLTKYAMGLMFVALQVLMFCLASFLVIGFRGGVWEPGLFIAVPMVVLFFSYLFAVCVLLGVMTRSSMPAILLTLLLWFGLYMVNTTDGVLLMMRAGAEMQVEEAEQRLALARAMSSEEIASNLEEIKTYSWMGGDDPRIAPLEAAQNGDFALLERDVIEADVSAGTWRKWSGLAYLVKTIFPKTSETIGLLERWLIELADLPANEQVNDPMAAEGDFVNNDAMAPACKSSHASGRSGGSSGRRSCSRLSSSRSRRGNSADAITRHTPRVWGVLGTTRDASRCPLNFFYFCKVTEMHLSQRTYRLALAPLALSGLLLLSGCGASPDATTAMPSPSTQQRAQVFEQIVATLCEDVMEGRDAGTSGIDIARDYLVYQYAKAGLEPGFIVEGQRTFTQEFQLRIGRDAQGEEILAPISNVGGILPGVGALADQVVILGAHYDHIGYGDIGSRAPSRHGEIHPGADDNASGTAGLVILARHMADFARNNPDTPRRTILFTSFAGEERGLHGSRFETENAQSWPFALADISGMVNMDMIGRLRDEKLIVYTTVTGEQWPDWINQANASTGDPLTISMDEEAPGGSDHSSFIRVGVPAVFFFTGLHAEYHTPDDTPDTLNNLGAARVLSVVGATLERLATDPDRVTFIPPPPRQPRPFLGVMPSESDEPGIVFGEVIDGGPADEAGVEAGDRVIAINGDEVEGFRSLRRVLRSSKPGDEVVLTIVRDGETMEITVELGGR